MPWTDEYLDDIESIDSCPECGDEMTVPPTGNSESPVLFIGDAPGSDELTKGQAFTGPTGNVLKSELRYHGYRLYDFRIMNMWQHKPDRDNTKCFELGIKTVLREAKNKQLKVLIGADTVKYFTGEKVSDWNGLITHSDMLGDVFIMVQPATVFHGGLGETRFAITRLAKLIEEILDGRN